MDTYLVGGAVRDKLLNYPVHEQDWVVVGATKQQMLAQGYKQVGRDFPVFLHPLTQEEYALARRERKIADGYYGFVCEADEHVSLVDDLLRRDLTINAMAMDANGNLIDPHGGVADLKAKKLRHVSPAFCEDPVRVLRVARFAARYHHLGFRLADETRMLIYEMVKKGELSHLVPERVWQEWQGSLGERHPEIFITTLRLTGALAIILPELDKLFGIPNVPQSIINTVDTGVRALNELTHVATMSHDTEFRFAALLYETGKGLTPLSAWPNHPEHAAHSVIVIRTLCERLRVPLPYRQVAELFARLHDALEQIDVMSAGEIVTILSTADAFRRPALFLKVLNISEIQSIQPVADKWRMYLTECLQVVAKSVVDEGFQGVFIGQEVHKRRIERLTRIKQNEQ